VVPKDDVTFSEVWRDKVLFSSFRISSQQASILVIPSPALGCSLLFRINVPPETLMTGFSESQAPQTTSKPSWNSPQTQAQTPQTCHLQLASKFQKLSGVFDALCSLKPTLYEIISFFIFMSHMHNKKNLSHF
jgi:hypothetical protein